MSSINAVEAFREIQHDLSEGLSLYWSMAAGVLDRTGIILNRPSADYFALENNYFSALFLYSFERAGIPRSRRIMYAAVNQCLRGMVTGCDNILDDEYKKTLDTNLPEQGARFRSVLDIMVSDRVLFAIFLTSGLKEGFSREQVLAASSASLRSLAESGMQEASEEGGIRKILDPDQVLRQVHHYKTGLLFQCPWAIPRMLENLPETTIAPLAEALYQIGIGCQLMDDMVDFNRDLIEKRHNYVISLIVHGTDLKERSRLKEGMNSAGGDTGRIDISLFDFPEAGAKTAELARRLLESGISSLLSPRHQYLVNPSLFFLRRRLGADRFMSAFEVQP